MTKKGGNAGKKKGNPQGKEKSPTPPPPAAEEEVSCGDSFIQIGNIKLSNVDLKNIVRKSEEMSAEAAAKEQDQTDEEAATKAKFMIELEAYANQASKEIIDSSVKHLPGCHSSPPPRVTEPQPVIMQNSVEAETIYRHQDLIQMAKEKLSEKIKQPPQEPPRLTSKKSYKKRAFGSGLVCPNGSETPFMEQPPILIPANTEEEMRMLWKECKSLLDDPVYLQRPDIIAHTILQPKFKRAFQFSLQMHFAATGMVRHQAYVYTGPDTYTRFRKWFRNKFVEKNNFQMFYRDFDGRYMEVHNDHTLKQMLVTHGAYPRGMYCNLPQVSAKVLCIPTNKFAQEEIENYMKDSVMGIQRVEMKSPDEDYWLRIPQIIAPDLRYREIARRLVYYTDEDLDHKYNQFTSVLQLLLFCQRDTTLEEMFSDVRNGDLSLNEIRGLLTERYENPYIGLSADKSIGLEVQVITERLRKSKFQTRDGLEYAETEMKNLVVEMKEAAAEKKKRAVEEQKKKEKQAQEEARLAQELIEQRALELERATKEAQRPRRYRCDGFKECTVKRSPNPNAVHIPGLSRVDIPYRHHDTSGFKEVKVHKVPELKKIKPPEPPKEHWTASMSSVRPAPQKSSGELLAQVKEIMAQCDTFAEEPQEEMSPLQQHALQKINEEEESPIDSSLLELEEQLREKLRETAGPSEPPPKGSPVKEKLKTS